jgi:hypothetical protein
MATLAEYQTWLTEAEQARHKIATGNALVEVWRDGRRVIFSKANMKDLDSYIADLEGKIAALGGPAPTSAAGNRRPGRVIW